MSQSSAKKTSISIFFTPDERLRIKNLSVHGEMLPSTIQRLLMEAVIREETRREVLIKAKEHFLKNPDVTGISMRDHEIRVYVREPSVIIQQEKFEGFFVRVAQSSSMK